MISFEEVEAMLDEVVQEIPREFFEKLNGGIVLLPDAKQHHASAGDLFILGEYHNDRAGYGGLGRYIAIYYGSFVRLYGYADAATQKAELRRVVIHEFTHHIESLAGERGLEHKDAQNLAKYRQRLTYRRQPPPNIEEE